MAINWRESLDVETTAVLCMEMQLGVLAADGPFSQLANAVERRHVVVNGHKLLMAARARGVKVVHCTAAFRSDRLGTPINTPLVASLLKNERHMLEGTPAIDVIPEWRDARDIESRRYHGLSPFTATNLDNQLRVMNINTVIVMGVSLNLGVLGLCIEAANLGYCVVVVADAVAGFPEDYAKAVLTNTLSLVATPFLADEVIGYWS